jgi:large subunit ribosomal protein L30
MAKLKVTQVKSTIKTSKTQKATIQALGLGKIGWFVEVENTPTFLGMINVVKHLVLVNEL